MSTTIYGNPNVNIDFDLNENYNVMMNFQKNTTNLTDHIYQVTQLQIANDSLQVIDSVANETFKQQLLEYYYRIMRLRNKPEGTWDNPFLPDSIYMKNGTSFEEVFDYRF